MSDLKAFGGRGRSVQPLTGEEMASMRHMLDEVDAAWATLGGLDRMAKSARALVSVIAVCAALGAALSWAVSTGVLQ